MSNFDSLKHYILPADLLMEMLNTYTFIGQNAIYDQKLESNRQIIIEQTLERDTFFLAKLVGIELSENRMRLIITKNSKPRSNEEKLLANVKEVLRSIQTNAKDYPFNSSDILSMLNLLFGKQAVKFSSEQLKDNNQPLRKSNAQRAVLKTRRLLFDQMLEEYNLYFTTKRYERLFLSLMAYVEMTNLMPFTFANELGSFLMLYYATLRANVSCFQYVSYWELLYENAQTMQMETKNASMNYQEGFIQITELSRFYFKLIQAGYQKLESIIKEYHYEERLHKSGNVEQTIYQLPDIFTKEDIKARHPFISESTINRALNKLRDANVIRPLSKGRSAKWIKITLPEEDYRRIIK